MRTNVAVEQNKNIGPRVRRISRLYYFTQIKLQIFKSTLLIDNYSVISTLLIIYCCFQQ